MSKEGANKLLHERRLKALTENVNFYRWGSGNADKDIADACIEAIEKEVEGLALAAGLTYSEHCVYLQGARSVINFIKAKIAKGEGQAHENNS